MRFVCSAFTLEGYSRARSPPTYPVVQSAKVELVINLETAKALGIIVPNTLIGRADEVIE